MSESPTCLRTSSPRRTARARPSGLARSAPSSERRSRNSTRGTALSITRPTPSAPSARTKSAGSFPCGSVATFTSGSQPRPIGSQLPLLRWEHASAQTDRTSRWIENREEDTAEECVAHAASVARGDARVDELVTFEAAAQHRADEPLTLPTAEPDLV